MNHLLFKILHLFLIFGLLSFYGCKHKGADENQSLDTQKNQVANNNNPCAEIVRMPLYLHTTTVYDSLFEPIYKSYINTTIKQENLKLRWDTLAKYIDYANLDNELEIGIGIYYVVDVRNTNDKYFSYVIAKSEKNDSQITPRAYNNKYLMAIKESPFYLAITDSQFTVYKNYYKKYVQFRNISDGNPYNVSAFGHPLVCYHAGDSVTLFFENNMNELGSLEDVYVKINNACLGPKKLERTGTQEFMYSFVQTPILLFEKNNTPLLDDRFYPQAPFRMKALDVGSLCPPECD